MAKPDQFLTVSVVETYWSGDNLSSRLAYGAHPEEEIDAIIRAVEGSPLLLAMIDAANEFVIRYPVSYYNNDQLESWAEFEQRVKRSKQENN